MNKCPNCHETSDTPEGFLCTNCRNALSRQTKEIKSDIELLDTFAGLAMQGLITNGKVPSNRLDVAEVAYEYAIAMIRVRRNIK